MLLKEQTSTHLADLFSALSDPTRLRIISVLLDGGNECWRYRLSTRHDRIGSFPPTARTAPDAPCPQPQGWTAGLLCARRRSRCKTLQPWLGPCRTWLKIFVNQTINMTSQSSHMHSHSHLREVAEQATSRLSLSLFLTLVFVVIEAGAGYFANSLALLTDAAHNLTDVIALALSWFAIRLTSQPANAKKTYGYHRAGILVALLNSTTLVLISIGIFYEAYLRFISPPDVKSSILIGVGLISIVINLVTAVLVHSGSQGDLNLRAAFVHLMGDVLSTVGAVIAGVIIYFTNAIWLDPLVCLLIGFLILYNAF